MSHLSDLIKQLLCPLGHPVSLAYGMPYHMSEIHGAPRHCLCPVILQVICHVPFTAELLEENGHVHDDERPTLAGDNSFQVKMSQLRRKL